ncbi:MAG: 16S rRNA (uracil(1498)-N(3))-methyltransferase [Crocinitomicaceae bacterium]|nr:MAG: 16S rRNA (uracil(1498)-N(3))-methyltransferase [Crocinitomicaceae bacterium]
MNLFYIPEVKPDTKTIVLSEEESKHACRVLRLKVGDQLRLLDGVGGSYVAEIADDHPKHCQVSIVSYTFEQPAEQEIHIAIAPTKNNERLEWFLEKATELGITEVSLVVCSNSERKQVKEERFEKILIAAMKQSQRTYLPRLNGLISFKDFLRKHPQGAIAHCYAGEKKAIKDVMKPSNYPILIGPEGDFSREEVDAALQLGYDVVSLGTNRLRTETAGLYACMLCLKN